MENQYITLFNEKEIRKIRVCDILYIEVDSYLSTYHTESGAVISCSSSLNKIEKILPQNFIRINRNCLVNSHKILTVDRRSRNVILLNSTKHTASVRKMKELVVTLMSQGDTLMG